MATMRKKIFRGSGLCFGVGGAGGLWGSGCVRLILRLRDRWRWDEAYLACRD